LEKLSWENYNEGNYLKEQVEAYHKRHGYYPEVVIADQIYRTRENRRYCKGLGIRLSGPLLGRPNERTSREQKKQECRESCIRNTVESPFGLGKRCYSLGRVMSKLIDTRECVIALRFLVMNLQTRLRFLFYYFLRGSLGGLFAWPDKG